MKRPARTLITAAILAVPAALSGTAAMAATSAPTSTGATAVAAASTPQCTHSASVPTRLPGHAKVIVPVSAHGSYNCWLAKGDVSSAVKAMQSALNHCNRTPVTADGIFGWRTRQAVINFQKAKHIQANGVYGPQTRSKMSFVALGGGCGFPV